jgi:hypothetical protein
VELYLHFTRGFFPVGEANRSSPSNAEVNEYVELYLHFSNTPSWRSAQLKHKGNFTFTLTFTADRVNCQ